MMLQRLAGCMRWLVAATRGAGCSADTARAGTYLHGRGTWAACSGGSDRL